MESEYHHCALKVYRRKRFLCIECTRCCSSFITAYHEGKSVLFSAASVTGKDVALATGGITHSTDLAFSKIHTCGKPGQDLLRNFASGPGWCSTAGRVATLMFLPIHLEASCPINNVLFLVDAHLLPRFNSALPIR